MEAALVARAFGDSVDVLAARDAEAVMGHVVFVLHASRSAAEQHQDEILLLAGARQPDDAAER
jgi:hypothetical protein